MTEDFLHYLWKEKLFDANSLYTDTGEYVEIVTTGSHNTNAGPDFFNAQIKIDGTLWAGNVEIHMQTSDWNRHNHQTDRSYDNCILHVVYLNDAGTHRTNGTRIPVVELKNRFQPELWDNYLRLLSSGEWIMCQNQLAGVSREVIQSMLDKMIEERTQTRTSRILIAIEGNKGDWEETFFQVLCRNFGFQVNAIPFEMLSRSIPRKIIRKEGISKANIESLLFGQAGMLRADSDDLYEKSLLENYLFLSGKYSLTPINNSTWKYLRLRPVNFPAVRIAQLSDLLFRKNTNFYSILQLNTLEELVSVFKVEASPYWNEHYHFGSPAAFRNKKLGSESINNILINTLIPFLNAFGKYSGEHSYSHRAAIFLKNLPAEINHITGKWSSIGIKPVTAEDSQALVHLKTFYCSEKRCLDCAIGRQLISPPL